MFSSHQQTPLRHLRTLLSAQEKPGAPPTLRLRGQWWQFPVQLLQLRGKKEAISPSPCAASTQYTSLSEDLSWEYTGTPTRVIFSNGPHSAIFGWWLHTGPTFGSSRLMSLWSKFNYSCANLCVAVCYANKCYLWSTVPVFTLFTSWAGFNKWKSNWTSVSNVIDLVTVLMAI